MWGVEQQQSGADERGPAEPVACLPSGGGAKSPMACLLSIGVTAAGLPAFLTSSATPHARDPSSQVNACETAAKGGAQRNVSFAGAELVGGAGRGGAGSAAPRNGATAEPPRALRICCLPDSPFPASAFLVPDWAALCRAR